jgi:hypothetical protein
MTTNTQKSGPTDDGALENAKQITNPEVKDNIIIPFPQPDDEIPDWVKGPTFRRLLGSLTPEDYWDAVLHVQKMEAKARAFSQRFPHLRGKRGMIAAPFLMATPPPIPAGVKPHIQIPGEGYRVEAFADELGPILAAVPVFNHHGVPKLWDQATPLDKEQLITISPQAFRGLIEEYTLPFIRSRRGSGGWQNFNKTISIDYAQATIAHPRFLKHLQPLLTVNRVRLPNMRKDGTIELLPKGYDAPSGIYTCPEAVDYDTRLSFKEAQKYLDGLLGEFCFTDKDRGRSKCVVLAMMLTLFSRHLFEGMVRPGFIYSANSEGAGKTTLAALGIIPLLGDTCRPAQCRGMKLKCARHSWLLR